MNPFPLVDGKGTVPYYDPGVWWGRMGWTKTQLDYVSREDFSEALKSAWEYAAQKRPRTPSAAGKKTARPKKATPKRKKSVKRR